MFHSLLEKKKSKLYSYLCHQFSLQHSMAPIKSIHHYQYTATASNLVVTGCLGAALANTAAVLQRVIYRKH